VGRRRTHFVGQNWLFSLGEARAPLGGGWPTQIREKKKWGGAKKKKEKTRKNANIPNGKKKDVQAGGILGAGLTKGCLKNDSNHKCDPTPLKW